MRTLIIPLLLLCLCLPCQSQVKWLNGQLGDPPSGFLLTPNPDYYGECIATGVTYTYAPLQTGKADSAEDDAAFRGKRLFDGTVDWRYPRPPGPTIAQNASVIFDFKRNCRFTELDVLCEMKPLSFDIDTSSDNKKWTRAYTGTATISESPLRRMPFSASGRYVRLTARLEGHVDLTEVWIWGSTRITEKEYQKAGLPSIPGLSSSEAIPGMPISAVSAEAYSSWKKELEAAKAEELPAVWSQAPAWNILVPGPVLPDRTKINQPSNITMCRNESEPAAFYLTNTDFSRTRQVDLQLSDFTDASGKIAPGLQAQLYVFAIQSGREFGPTPFALISKENKPGADFLRRWCLNGAQIMDFPRVNLPPAGTAILWVKIKSSNPLPGKYRATLSCKQGGEVKLHVQVTDILLPRPRVWVNYWTNEISMSPFRPTDYAAKEAQIRHEMAMNVVDGWPEPGSGAWELQKLDTNTLFKIWGMGQYGYKLWSAGHQGTGFGVKDFTVEMREDLKNIVRAQVNTAKNYNLDYGQWFIESGDEPSSHNLELFGEMLKVCKEADPNVMYYLNPCGWLGLPDKVVEDDDTMYPTMKDWYNKYVDISVPSFLNLSNQPNTYTLYTAPRPYNAIYDVLGSKTRSNNNYGLINYPRFLAWMAIKHNMNGWAYYSIYQPRGNPWDDMDQPDVDYLTIFPGPQGPVITRGAEASTEAYEDYCLMYLLKQKNPKIHQDLIEQWTKTGDYEAVRLQAIEAITGN